MNCIQYLNSIEEVENLVSEIQKRRINSVLGLSTPIQEYYRGQVSDTFEIKPSLSRNSKDSLELEKVELRMMEDFKSQIIDKGLEKSFLMNPYCTGEFKDDWYLLAQAQHCGLPTRLLDWALKWEVALFFAVEDNNLFNDHDGQFWVLSLPESLILNNSTKI